MIVIIGSINMDLVLRVPRMPQPGETLAAGQLQTIPGGKGANQAVACARLGSTPVAMIGCVGDDVFGAALRAALRVDKIEDTHVHTIAATASGVASILVDAAGQNSIVLAAGANACLSPAHIDAARDVIAQAKIIVLQLEIPLATVQHALALAAELGKVVVLNPAPAQVLPRALLAQVTYLIPNEIEAAMLVGEPVLEPALALARLRTCGASNVLLTLGAQGVYAGLAGGACLYPAQPVVAVDTTAAGDTFIGGFVAALAEGQAQAQAIGLGQRAAAMSVTRPGAQASIPYRAELGAV